MRDEDGLVVARGEPVFAVLNLYPYNAGHLMVVPFRHVADYTELTPEETAEVARAHQAARCGCCARSAARRGSTSG